MARTTTKKPPAKRRAASSTKRKKAPRPTKTVKAASRRRPEKELTAKEALVGILESPLVAEVIAAGAAAALSTITQQALSKRSGGTAKTLKEAAKAAGVAMGARLSLEAEEIMKAAKGGAKPGEA
jgi:hypothetical protein